MKQLHLITQIATSPDRKRQAEYDYCINRNIRCGLFSSVTLKSGRPTFSEHFQQSQGFDGVCVLANSGIVFDETIRLARHLPPGEVWALTRWEAGKIHTREWNTQDVWIFHPGTLVCADWMLGVGACDDCMNHALTAAGYKVRNPSLTIKTHHIHGSQARTWRSIPQVKAPKMSVLPEVL